MAETRDNRAAEAVEQGLRTGGPAFCDVTEEEYRAADEARYKERQRLTEAFHVPVVAFRLSLRGPQNRGGAADLAFRRGLDDLFDLTGAPVFWEQKEERTGCEALLVCDVPAEELRSLCRTLTAEPPGADLYIAEVFDENGTLLEAAGRPCADSGITDLLLREEAARYLADAAVKALILAARFTPKPGILDSENAGIYEDRDLAAAARSAQALRPYFERAAKESLAGTIDEQILREIADGGARAAREAAGGAAIHNSALTLFLPAIAGMAESLAGGGLASENGAALAKRMGPVSDMDRREHRAVFEKFGTRGIVEQAEKGFPAARQAEAMLLRDGTDLLAPFLAIAAGTSDAHLLLRGGLEAQLYVRTEMKRILESPEEMRPRMAKILDGVLIRAGYGPEEAVDHLALALWIRQMDGAGFDF